MVLRFAEKNIKLVFEKTEDNRLLLLDMSGRDALNLCEEKKKVCSAVGVHIAGENPDDHHGGKHTGTSCEYTLKYVSHKYYTNENGKKIEFELSNDKINVIQHYQMYNDVSVIRAWTEIENISKENVGIEYVSSFAFTGIDGHGQLTPNEKLDIYIPHNSWEREIDWKKYTLSEAGFDKTTPSSTKRISVSNTGTWSTKEYLPMGVLDNKEDKCSYMWQIENNGSWQWEIGDIADMMYLRISGPTEAENHWYKELKPNESFESVKAAICVGESFDDALGEMTRYRRRIAYKNKADEKLPVIFNDYMNCLWADPTTEKEIPVIDRAAELGAQYYCMDAGWYADGTWWETVGEWEPCQWRFKNGIKEVFDYIREKGMVPGIWLEIEVMGINCPILDQFSDDCFFMRHGKRVIDHGRYQLDFRNPKVRDFAMSVIDRVVSEYGVGYIKMDYNIDAGIGTEVNASSCGEGLLEHNRAYLRWIDEVNKKYPELIIENCSSGGMRLDYAMLSRHTIQSVTDQSNCIAMAPIAAAASTAVLPEQAAIWSYPMDKDNLYITAMNMVNSMLQRIHLSGDVLNMSEEQRELVKKAVELYKGIRKDIPDSIPFYPTGLPQYGDGWLCSGYKKDGKGYLAVWRIDSDDEELVIPMELTFAEILYANEGNCKVSVLNDKLFVKLNEKNSAAILCIKY